MNPDSLVVPRRCVRPQTRLSLWPDPREGQQAGRQAGQPSSPVSEDAAQLVSYHTELEITFVC